MSLRGVYSLPCWQTWPRIIATAFAITDDDQMQMIMSSESLEQKPVIKSVNIHSLRGIKYHHIF